MQRVISVLAGLLLTAVAGVAHASFIETGSAFTLSATNAPDTYTATTTFGGTVSVDGGAASLTMSQIAGACSGCEWDIWTLTTTSGGPIAGNADAYWDITMSYVLSKPADFIAVVDQWTYNGTPVSPINNFGGICCASSTNPATGGEAYYNYGFSGPLAAGTQSNWDQIYVDPYSYAYSGGIPADANGFTWALEFSPVATPLPAALPLFASGLGAMGLLGWRKKRKNAGAIAA